MNVTATVSRADSWGMHSGGWWILGAIVMMAFMGAMMWMMMRGMGGSSKRPSQPGERPGTGESAVEILERRFAEGEISIEDYRQRREALTHAAGREQDRADGRASQASRKEEP